MPGACGTSGAECAGRSLPEGGRSFWAGGTRLAGGRHDKPPASEDVSLLTGRAVLRTSEPTGKRIGSKLEQTLLADGRGTVGWTSPAGPSGSHFGTAAPTGAGQLRGGMLASAVALSSPLPRRKPGQGKRALGAGLSLLTEPALPDRARRGWIPFSRQGLGSRASVCAHIYATVHD